MPLIILPYIFSSGTTIIASQTNNNNTTFINLLNGGLDNANFTGTAGITYANLTLGGNIVNADINSSAAIANSKLNLSAIAQAVTFNGITLIGAANQGDIFYDNGTQITRLTHGINGQFLQTQGSSANPQWATPLIISKSILTVNASFTQSTTTYSCPGDTQVVSSTQTNHAMVINNPGTIKNLYINTTNGNSGTMVITVYKNTSAQTLTATVGSTNMTANDTTHSFTVIAGDTISFENVNGRGSVALTSISVEIDI